LENIEESPYDLIFLDIELGEINGVEVGHIIREQMEDYITKIIYISSKDIYDRQLFDVQPLHFLKKPIDSKKVFADIQLAMKISEKENKSFEFKSFRKTVKVPYKDILYFESKGREIFLFGTKNNYNFYGNIKSLEEVLPKFFIHPNRSYFVNYEFITCFKFEELIMTDGSIIPISRNKRKEIRELQLVFERKGQLK
ncbi:MAG: DNA-binding response regulator, partial [Lachnospiraceae bacterium]